VKRVKRKKLLVIASVALIATFLAVPLVSAYTNYDIMTAIRNVQCKLNSTFSKLASVQNVVNNIFTIVNNIATKLTSVNTKIDGIATNVNDIKTQLSAPANSEGTTILAYYDGGGFVNSGYTVPVNSTVFTSKPALFTVSVVSNIDKGSISIVRQTTSQYGTVNVKYLVPDPTNGGMQDSFTFAGESVEIHVENLDPSAGTFFFSIMVQGSPDTVITFHS